MIYEFDVLINVREENVYIYNTDIYFKIGLEDWFFKNPGTSATNVHKWYIIYTSAS